MDLKQKIILIFLSLLVLITGSLSPLFAKRALAQSTGPWYAQDFPQWYVKVFEEGNPDEIFGERYTAAQVQWVFYAVPGQIITYLFGPKLVTCVFSGNIVQCITAAFDFIKNRLNDMLSFFGLPPLSQSQTNEYHAESSHVEKFSIRQFFYNNPMSGIGYVLRKIDNFSLVPQARAQGFGFSHGAETVRILWVATRNIAYSLLVVFTVILAFMIMFRVKLSPQTVISVQSALPKVVITIILIAFSFAIAGLLIDLMYLVIGLISIILDSSEISSLPATELFKDLTNDRNAFVLTWQFVVVWFVAAIATTISASFFGGLLALVFTVVALVMALFHSFKIIWVLIKTYVNILLLIIVAPFQILMGMISSTVNFGSWVRSMLANLMVYPVVGLMFVLAFFFLSQSLALIIADLNLPDLGEFMVPFELKSELLPTTNSWDPPLTWGTNSGRFLYMMAAFAIFALIPKVADIIKGMIEGRPIAYGTAIGEAVTSPLSSIYKVVGTVADVGKFASEEFGKGGLLRKKAPAPPQASP